MSKRQPNDARPGQRVVEITCCDGPRLVKEDMAPRWDCNRCHRNGQRTGLFEFDKDMNLVALSTEEVESYL